MLRKWFPLFVILLFILVQPSFHVGAQTGQDNPPRVLLVGDSWAGLMWFYESYQLAFDEHGFADVQLDARLIGEGGTAHHWAQPQARQKLTAHIAQNPGLDTVVISLGGNDLRAKWTADMNQKEEDLLLESIWWNLQEIVSSVLDVRPEIEVLLMGYDYTNFFEASERDGSGRTASVWRRLGQPTPDRINQLTIRFERFKVQLAKSYERVYYVQAFGLMQYIFGYPNPPDYVGEGFEAFSVPLPGQSDSGFDPFPGGDPAYPSPPAAMAEQGKDPVHLNRAGYRALAYLHMEAYFIERFRGEPAQEFTAHASGFSGWVRSDGILDSGELILGAEGGSQQYRAIISFETAPIHDRAEITRASLYLVRKGECCGDNPFIDQSFGAPRLDLAADAFGALELQAADFDDPSGLSGAGIFHGSVRDDGHTLRIDLSPAALQVINKRGWTQLRLSFPDNSSGQGAVHFHLSGESAPRLDVYYEAPPFSLVDLIDPGARSTGVPVPAVIGLSALCCLGVLLVIGGTSWVVKRRRTP